MWLTVLSAIALLQVALAFAGAPIATGPTRPVVVVSVIGTSDLHGAIAARADVGGLDVFAGYLANLRRRRAPDGAVVLLDAGDLFQGTLESNLAEGAPVVRAYNELAYDAVAIGNHEFDYGPAGEHSAPRSETDDPFGALRLRVSEARFPFLAANLRDASKGGRHRLPASAPSVLLDKAGVAIGVVGLTSAQTLAMTLAANVRSLAIEPLAPRLAAEARNLRERGARLVIALVHAGGRCSRFDDPDDLEGCDQEMEIMRLARDLEPGLIDLIVAGHTHQGMAHRVNGIPVVQSWSGGRAFSRVDFRLEPATGRKLDVVIHPPQEIRLPASYEGRRVVTAKDLTRILAPDLQRARSHARRPLGAVASARISRSRERESALGNLVADLMLAARPAAEVAIVNGGGLRADLPAGPVDYGDLYEVHPFDNRFALVRLSGRELAQLLARALGGRDSIWSIAGTQVNAACRDGKLSVTTGFGDDQELLLVTSDFLVTSGDFADIDPLRIEIESGAPLREHLAEALERRGGVLRSSDLLDPANPRLAFEGGYPPRCRARTGSGKKRREAQPERAPGGRVTTDGETRRQRERGQVPPGDEQ